ncbi:MAG: ABC transporter permease [Lachnospiraceae bacterium]|nr:ABC transporter permease [Ruminococcus sp.]MCM1274293.1 ABC transporter permease [Lachnospiraceae bacterium]
MNTFFDLVGFEFKKMLCRKRTVIVLALVIIVSAVSVFGTIIGNIYYYDESGKEISVSKYSVAMTERRGGEELSGRVIDADLIMEAKAYNTTNKYDNFVNVMVTRYFDYDTERFFNLTREQAERFDEIRRDKLKSSITSSASENVQKYRLECIDNSPAPLTYEYFGGYYRFVTIMYTTAIMAGAAIAVMLSGIFSDEYASGADSLILSSRHGKGLVIGAKLFTTFSVSAALITLLSAMSFIETTIVWGPNGANAMLEFVRDVFPYPIMIGQAVLLYFICMLTACAMFAAITILLSAKLKLPFNTLIITVVLLIVPLFIQIDAPVWVYRLINLLPTNMFTFWNVMGEYQYEIFGLVVPPYVFLPIFALTVAAVCSYFAYRAFRKHQVN